MKTVRLTRGEAKLRAEQARIRSWCEDKGVPVPDKDNQGGVEVVGADGVRTVTVEFHAEPQDNTMTIRRMKLLGYEVKENKELREFTFTKKQSSFEEDRRKAHDAHQKMVVREATPDRGDQGGGLIEHDASTYDAQITDIEDVLMAAPAGKD